MIKRIIWVVLAAAVLGGCAALNPPDSFYEAQGTAAAADAGARAAEAAHKKPCFEMTGRWGCSDPDAENCRIALGDIQCGSNQRVAYRVDEGHTAGKVVTTVVEQLPEVVEDVVTGAVLLKAFNRAGDRVSNINGDGNTLDASETREYSLSSGDGSRIKSGDDQRAYDDVANNKQQDVGNQKPVDNRQNYGNSTATPTVVEQDRAVIVRPEVVPTETASPFVYNALPATANQ